MKRRQKRKSNILILAGVTGCLLVTQPVCAQETNRQKSEQKTVITANVAHYIEEPSYIMSIPSAANFGALDSENDQIQNYSIDIDVKDKTGILTVSAPEGGILNSGTNTLKFENDFGNQEIVLSDLKDEEKITKSLSGTLTIREIIRERPHLPLHTQVKKAIQIIKIMETVEITTIITAGTAIRMRQTVLATR